MQTKLLSRVMSFAHLGGIAASTAEEDEAERKAEDDAKREETEKAEKGKKAKKAKAASEDDPDEDGDDEDEKKKDDEDDDEEMQRKGRARSARLRERARCAAIFGLSAAAGRVGMVATLAFTTDLSATQAVALLKSSPAAPSPAAASSHGSALDAAMARVAQPRIGGDAPAAESSPRSGLIAAVQKITKS